MQALIWGGVGEVLFGILAAYLGIIAYRPNRSLVSGDTAFRPRGTLAELWLRRIGFIMLGFANAFIGLNVVLLGSGWYNAIWASGDQVMYVGTIICTLISGGALFAWMVVRHFLDKRT